MSEIKWVVRYDLVHVYDLVGMPTVENELK